MSLQKKCGLPLNRFLQYILQGAALTHYAGIVICHQHQETRAQRNAMQLAL